MKDNPAQAAKFHNIPTQVVVAAGIDEAYAILVVVCSVLCERIVL